MKYYVTADVHAYFTELQTALREQGFFEDTEPHKLVIRGNHEDLAMDLLYKGNAFVRSDKNNRK